MFRILTIELNGTDDFNYPHGEKKTLQPQHLTHPRTQAYSEIYALINTHTHSEWVLPAPPRVWGWCLSYTHHLYSYHTDATYSVNTHSPPPPLRSLTPSIRPSPFLHPPVLSSKCLSLTICILLLLLVHAGCSHSLSLKHKHTHTQVRTHTHIHTHAHASEQMSFLHMLLLIAPLLTHHLLFILRWVHTGCPRQPSIYIVIERGGDKSKGEERGRQEGPIESGSYDCSLCTASSSQTPTLFTYLFSCFQTVLLPLISVFLSWRRFIKRATRNKTDSVQPG